MILVTGATGNVGRPLVDLLLARGAKVRALTRDPGAAALRAGVEPVRADLSDPASLAGVCDGVTRAFLVTHVPGDPAQAGNFLAEARRAGVEHLVALSSLSTEALIPGDPIGGGHRDLEATLGAAGIPATVLRPGTFHSNALHWAAQVRDGDTVRAMAAAPAYPIDPRDIAAVAAKVLMDPAAHAAILPLTGPGQIDTAGQVAEVAALLGRALTFEPLPLAVLVGWVRESSGGIGDPEATIAAVSGAAVPWARPRNTLRQVTGSSGRTFREWAQTNLHAFR